MALKTLPIPSAATGQVLIKIIACGVYPTDLHITDGELTQTKLPLIIGHEIVGMAVKNGSAVTKLNEGDFVVFPGSAIPAANANIVFAAKKTYVKMPCSQADTLNGGYAQYTAAYEQYCFPLGKMYTNAYGGHLLCAGLIGFRS